MYKRDYYFRQNTLSLLLVFFVEYQVKVTTQNGIDMEDLH